MLTLTVRSTSGTQRVSKNINVIAQPNIYNNPYDRYPTDGSPPHNSQVLLPTPDDTLSDKVVNPPTTTTTLSAAQVAPANILRSIPLALSGGIGILLIAIVGIAFTILRKRRV
jgi:hypothetical protein